MLGVKAIRRRLRRMTLRRKGYRPEEEVFGRFAERFGATVRKGKPEEPQEAQEGFQEKPRQEEKPRGESRREIQQDTPPPAVPASPALEVLGLGAGASKAEVVTAYRRLARTYHPDKVAHLAPEAREFAEERMKEINAAYSELRGHF